MCGPALVYAQIISYRNFQSVTVEFHEHQGGRLDPDRVIVGYNYSLGNKKRGTNCGSGFSFELFPDIFKIFVVVFFFHFSEVDVWMDTFVVLN